jgi:hypothetical protein
MVNNRSSDWGCNAHGLVAAAHAARLLGVCDGEGYHTRSGNYIAVVVTEFQLIGL